MDAPYSSSKADVEGASARASLRRARRDHQLTRSGCAAQAITLKREISGPGRVGAERLVAISGPVGAPQPVIRQQWQELNPRLRQLILVGAALEGMLKVAAIVDLARTPSQNVQGPKWRWAAAILLINSGGAVPIAYFRSRHRT